MLTRRTVLAIAAPSLLACSGLATPPTPDGPPASRSDEPVADEPPVMIPDGPWVLELEDADGRCSWRMRGLEGTPVSLGQHDGGCPSGWSLGVDERGVPSVGITESGQVILRDHQDLQPIPPPPAGEPVRAAWLDGDVVVDTRVPRSEEELSYGLPASGGDRAVTVDSASPWSLNFAHVADIQATAAASRQPASSVWLSDRPAEGLAERVPLATSVPRRAYLAVAVAVAVAVVVQLAHVAVPWPVRIGLVVAGLVAVTGAAGTLRGATAG